MTTLTALAALAAFTTTLQAAPRISIRATEAPTGSGEFRIYAHADAPVLTFRQGRFYPTFTFDLESTPQPGAAHGIYRHCLRAGQMPWGRVAPAKYFWTGPMPERVEIVADPLRRRPGE